MVKDYDLYNILNLKSDATINEIKIAYRKLARKYHPDLNSSKEAEEHIKLINIAYGILGNPDKRQKYDFMRKYGVNSDKIFSTNYGDTIQFTNLSEFFEFLSSLESEELERLLDGLFEQLFGNFIKGLLEVGDKVRRRIRESVEITLNNIEETARTILDILPFRIFRRKSS